MTQVALRGGRWMAMQSVGLQVLAVVTTAILARLLAPEDFGVIAITTVLVGLFTLVNSFGISASVIRRRDLDETVLSTYFWLALILGSAATALLVALSGVLASSFDQPSSAPFIAGIAPVLLFSLVRSVPVAVLSRELRFGPVAVVAMLDFIAYASVAVALAAVTDIGAWSVIVGRLAGSSLSLVAAFGFSGWWPQTAFRWAAVLKDIPFNAGVWTNGLIGFLSRNLDYWVVARLGVRALGVYYIAYVLPNVLRRRLTLASTEVMFPVFSQITDDRERLSRGFLDATRFTSLTSFPVLFGLATVVDVVIVLFFGTEYVAAVGPAAILAVASAITILLSVSYPVFLADGVPFRASVAGFIRLAVTGLGLVIAASVGSITAAAWAVLAASCVSVLAAQVMTVQRLPLRLRDVASSVAPALVCSTVMVATVLAAKRALGEAAVDWPGLVALVLIGVVAYLGTGFIAFRAVFVELLGNLKTAVTSSKQRGGRETEAADLTAEVTEPS